MIQMTSNFPFRLFSTPLLFEVTVTETTYSAPKHSTAVLAGNSRRYFEAQEKKTSRGRKLDPKRCFFSQVSRQSPRRKSTNTSAAAANSKNPPTKRGEGVGGREKERRPSVHKTIHCIVCLSRTFLCKSTGPRL
jgi:hypothetical protein